MMKRWNPSGYSLGWSSIASLFSVNLICFIRCWFDVRFTSFIHEPLSLSALFQWSDWCPSNDESRMMKSVSERGPTILFIDFIQRHFLKKRLKQVHRVWSAWALICCVCLAVTQKTARRLENNLTVWKWKIYNNSKRPTDSESVGLLVKSCFCWVRDYGTSLSWTFWSVVAS
jgi:hypothetical protein